MTTIEYKYNKTETNRKLFNNFVMPMIILAIRVEIEIIFKMNYRKFLLEKKRVNPDPDKEN